MLAKFSLCLRNFLHSEIAQPVILVFLIPNDHVLINYHFIPYVISYFRHFCIFTLWVCLYKLPHNFVTLTLIIQYSFPQLFILGLIFALFSLLFLSFSRLPNTPLEDDNSRDAWLGLIALKRRVASLVLGQLQVVLML